MANYAKRHLPHESLHDGELLRELVGGLKLSRFKTLGGLLGPEQDYLFINSDSRSCFFLLISSQVKPHGLVLILYIFSVDSGDFFSKNVRIRINFVGSKLNDNNIIKVEKKKYCIYFQFFAGTTLLVRLR